MNLLWAFDFSLPKDPDTGHPIPIDMSDTSEVNPSIFCSVPMNWFALNCAYRESFWPPNRFLVKFDPEVQPKWNASICNSNRCAPYLIVLNALRRKCMSYPCVSIEQSRILIQHYSSWKAEIFAAVFLQLVRNSIYCTKLIHYFEEAQIRIGLVHDLACLTFVLVYRVRVTTKRSQSYTIGRIWLS